MKRKILSTIAIMLAMSLMLTACGGKTETETSVSGNTSEIAEEEISETNEKTEETEEKDENEETEEPTEEVKPTEEPASTEEPVHTHTWSKATCTSPKTCSCGETSGSPLGHSFSNGKCSRCGAKDPNYQEPTPPAHTHSYTSKVTAEATCTSNGTITYTCSCGHSYTESTSALGHNYQDHEETIHHPGEMVPGARCDDCGLEGTIDEIVAHQDSTAHRGWCGIEIPGGEPWDEIIHHWICSRCGASK